MVKNAHERLWNDTCSIYHYHEQMTENKSTRFEEVCVMSNVPCRISYETMRTSRKTEVSSANAVRVKLFCDKDVEIKPGSKIVVERDGKEFAFKNSGIPSVYRFHQEILLTQFDGWV